MNSVALGVMMMMRRRNKKKHGGTQDTGMSGRKIQRDLYTI